MKPHTLLKYTLALLAIVLSVTHIMGVPFKARGHLGCFRDSLSESDSAFLYLDYEILARAPLRDFEFELSCDIDTTYIMNGYVSLNKSPLVVPVFLESGVIDVSCVEQRDSGMYLLSVTGTPFNDMLTRNTLRYAAINYEMIDVSADSTLDNDVRLERIDELLFEQSEIFENMVTRYGDSRIGPYLCMPKYYGGNDYRGLKGALKRLSVAGLDKHPATDDLQTVLAMMPGVSVGDSIMDFVGRYTLVDLWSSVNDICLRDFSILKNIARELSGDDFEVVGVCGDPGKAMMDSVVGKYGLFWRQIYNPEFSSTYNISVYPTRLLIDPRGRVVARDPELSVDVIRGLIKTNRTD